ncbi:hypothetical protein DASC09_026160 [Saccharomycopsis crataegensis]|uniref:Uncharacterized protein n=1 Tax=Saccharomycopsis crataegensis TaxID=43959 RepID=A0AAV5QKT9_9ASCO|nr:hypothetical protein DASC09_026160 [Saccharomycopsis crataegensis]
MHWNSWSGILLVWEYIVNMLIIVSWASQSQRYENNNHDDDVKEEADASIYSDTSDTLVEEVIEEQEHKIDEDEERFKIDEELRKRNTDNRIQHQQIVDLHEENKDLMAMIAKLHDVHESLKKENKMVTDENQNLRKDIDRSKAKITKIKGKNVNYSTTNSRLKVKLQNSLLENKNLRKDLQLARQTNTDHLRSMNQLYEKVHLLKHQLTINDDKLAYQNYVRIKEEELQHKSALVATLTESNENLQKEIEDKMTDYLSFLNKLSELQSSNDSFKEEVSKLEFKVARLTEDNQRVRNERAESKQQQEVLTKKISELIEEVKMMEEVNHDLNIQHEDHLKVIESLRKLNESTTNTQKKMRKELDNSLISKQDEIIRLKKEIENLQDTNTNINPQVALNEDAKENQELNQKIIRMSSTISQYIVKLSESQLCLKIKESNVKAMKEELTQHRDFFNNLEPFIDKFSQDFITLVTVVQKIVPKYNEQKMFLNKLIQMVSVEEKNFIMLNELRDKNSRFKKLLRRILDENLRVKNELEISYLEIKSLKDQLLLKDEFITVLKYGNDNSALNLQFLVNHATNHDDCERSVSLNDFQTKDIFINDHPVVSPSDISSIDENSNCRLSPASQQSDISETMSTIDSIATRASSIQINLNDLTFFGQNEKFSGQLTSFLKGGVVDDNDRDGDATFSLDDNHEEEFQLQRLMDSLNPGKTNDEIFAMNGSDLNGLTSKMDKEVQQIKRFCISKTLKSCSLPRPSSAGDSYSNQFNNNNTAKPPQLSLQIPKKLTIFKDSEGDTSAESSPTSLSSSSPVSYTFSNGFTLGKPRTSRRSSLHLENSFYTTTKPQFKTLSLNSNGRSHDLKSFGLTPNTKNQTNVKNRHRVSNSIS